MSKDLFQPIFSKLKEKSYQKDQIDLVQKAFLKAKKAHETQKRASGEAYITHPLKVCEILIDLNMDHEALIAGLLHDAAEDTSYSLEEIKKDFGLKITHLVDGVTKISHLRFNNLKDQRSENIKKIFFAMQNDLRVVMIKLADRLHNIKTLSFMDLDHQKKKSIETLEIYVPLAARLGMYDLKTELEDLCLSYLHPEKFNEIKENLSKTKGARDENIEKIKKTIFELMKNKVSDGFQISGRLKNIYSIYKKIEDQKIPFDQVYDILAFRLCLSNISECYLALGLIHSLWIPIPSRFKDFIAHPKQNSYQSLHTTVLTEKKQRIEIQIRTFEMHEMAEKGIASHWTYKEKTDGFHQKKMIERFKGLRDLLSKYQESGNASDFLEDFKSDLQEEEIHVFTPLGDLKIFPKKASIIDVAFSIHSDLGKKVTGAKVNGKIQGLKYEVCDGDVVEILTSKNQSPSADWLKLCVTSKARSYIRSYLRFLERIQAQKMGEKHFSKIIKSKISLSKLLQSSKFKDLLKEKGCQKKEDLFALLGYGKYSLEDFESFIESFSSKKDEVKLSEKTSLTQAKSKTKKQSFFIEVEGESSIDVSLAKCCYPVFGDDIMGFITQGRGIVVHRSNCSQASLMDPEREVSVRWPQIAFKENQTVKLKVLVHDRSGVLNELTEAIGLFQINISDLTISKNIDHSAACFFFVEVKDNKQLEDLILHLTKLKSVYQVSRV